MQLTVILQELLLLIFLTNEGTPVEENALSNSFTALAKTLQKP